MSTALHTDLPSSSFPRTREPSDADPATQSLNGERHWVPAFAGMTARAKLAPFAMLLFLAGTTAFAQEQSQVLDNFEHPGAWTVVTSDQVSGTIRKVLGDKGGALCLDYDFNGVSGYAGIQRDLQLEYPTGDGFDYRFDYQLRGDSPANDLQFKLVDASGDNVWWVNRTRVDFPAEWTPVTHRKRHISRAWGPAEDSMLRRSAKLEFTVYSSAGGAGSVCFDTLTFSQRALPDTPPPRPVANASASQPAAAALAVDGDVATAWRAPAGGPVTFELDLGRLREFGGLRLDWLAGQGATAYRIELSDDGRAWRPVRQVTAGNGGCDLIALPESEARHVRLVLEAGEGDTFGLTEVAVEPLEFAATPNDFIRSVAAGAPRGHYPRGFIGEQPYWTVVGIDGGTEQGLVGEDGAVEVARGGFSLEPFVLVDGNLVTWADVEARQSLQDGYLPIPTVHWAHPAFALDVTAFAQGKTDTSRLVTRYRLENTGDVARDFELVLMLRPLQVNSPTQFLSTVGGVSPIEALEVGTLEAKVDGKPRVRMATPADAAFASAFDSGLPLDRLDAPDSALDSRVDDATGLASGAWRYRMQLAPGETREFAWQAPLTGVLDEAPLDAEAAQAAVAEDWHGRLDRVRIDVPKDGRKLVDTLRTALAHMLISREGPRLQPGTRSYSRAWIRDGAMIAEGLLRLGREDVAEDFLRWYAPYQFDNGKVPCCVDDRGSDPVPENDSHGELVYTVAEIYRYTRDRALLEAMWPHVAGAVSYMDELRVSERTEANRAVNPAFYGMMPASISHEGYSAKPMHSYWDNFWTLRGYKDAVLVAQWLGRDADAKRFAASRDQFRSDLMASLRAATAQHGIDYLPGAAELGDFDPTSTTIALAPGGEQAWLPQDLLDNTFQRYWREFVARREGTREWKEYTPYELRNVGAFVRLGWRDRAHEALDFFFGDQQPRGWNQWAEVVSRTPRKPFFVGDLPHAWVESDYVRSALEMFAYVRDGEDGADDDALVLAAGVPRDWLAGEGIAVAGLRTPYGELDYRLRRDAEGSLRLSIGEGLRVPDGGVVVQPPGEWAGEVDVASGEAAWVDGELRIDRLPAEVTLR